MTEPVVKEGQILCLRLFDIGDEVDLDKATTLLAKVPGAATNRRPLSKMETLAVPLRVELGKREIEIMEIRQPLETKLSIHVYDSGSISVTFTIEIDANTPLGSIIPRVAALYTSRDVETLARDELNRLLPTLMPAVSGPHDWQGFETYTIVRVYELANPYTPDELLDWAPLGRLMVGEPGELRLRNQHREEVLEYNFGYLEDDLVVVDWNTAFMLDPRRDPTIVEMLEFANCHLLNLRYYDHLLDAETKRIYGEITQHPGVFNRRYKKLVHEVLQRIVALGELSDRIDNTTKVVGDYYTARVYRAALVRLRVTAWNESIERKQRLVAEAYGMLKAEVESRRSLFLEIAIVGLIVFEVIWAIATGMH